MKDRITLGHEADVEEPQGADQQRHPPIGEERPSICPKRPQGEAMGRSFWGQAPRSRYKTTVSAVLGVEYNMRTFCGTILAAGVAGACAKP